jgi:hypothetical protein
MSGVSEIGEAMVEEIVSGRCPGNNSFHGIHGKLLSLVGIRRSSITRYFLYNELSTNDSISAVYPPIFLFLCFPA